MKIGTVFDQTSTTEFVVMLDQQYDSEQLLFSYVELSPGGGRPNPKSERMIARIISLHKENPLLSRDQAGVAAAIDIGDLGYDFSRRFTYGWAKCTIVGSLSSSGRLDMNRRVPAPNSEAHTPSTTSLQQLFFRPSPAFIPIGSVETFGEEEITDVPVTLNADQMVTKHFCIFGMTGSGKTNTSAKIVEELMARGHRMIIFDTHDDYVNLESYSNLYQDIGLDGEKSKINKSKKHASVVQYTIEQLNPLSNDRPLKQCVEERLLRTASVIFNNTPAREILRSDGVNNESFITTDLVDALKSNQIWKNLLSSPRVRNYNHFPELRFYGNGFEDYTIVLLQAFRDEEFSGAQWRWLRNNINQQGFGINYLSNLENLARNQRNNPRTPRHQLGTLDVLIQSFNTIRSIYQDALQGNASPLDMEQFFTDVSVRENGTSENVYRLSLTNLSSNLRRAMVYGVITYFFRSYKFRGYRATAKGGQEANAHPILFVLEEARALIPKSSGISDIDYTGSVARRAMRELAYEGRKFSLGFGLISQKPSSVDAEVVSQSNTFILHQLKSPDDQQYVRAVTETMSLEELDMVKSLGIGRAIVSGVAVRSPVLLKVYFRYSEEGIQEPTPLSDELDSVGQIREQLGIT